MELSELLGALLKPTFVRSMARGLLSSVGSGEHDFPRRRAALTRAENAEAEIDRLVHRYCAQPRLPEYWEKLLGVTVLDPDGWRNRSSYPGLIPLQPRDWAEPITRFEFEVRLSESTVRRVGPSRHEVKEES